MVRKLKFHEAKLLKQVDFHHYKHENNLREIEILRRFHVQNREDYGKYNKLCGRIKEITNQLALLDPADPFKHATAATLVERLYKMGLIPSEKLADCDKVTVSSFCRRRLPIVMVKLKLCETVREAVTFVEQGHIRVGSEIITDPAYLVTRSMEDFVTWVDTSRIRRKVLAYNNQLDDFDFA